MRVRSVGTVGEVSVVCASKTGVLTGEDMMVSEVRTAPHVFSVTGKGYDPVGSFASRGRPVVPSGESDLLLALRTAALAARGAIHPTEHGWIPEGHPVDAALTVLAGKAGLDRGQLLAESRELAHPPFSEPATLSGRFYRRGSAGLVTACLKGTPDRVLSLCSRAHADGVDVPLDEPLAASLMEANHLMSIRGLRVIALAHGLVDDASEPALRRLTFAGLVGLIDPPARGAFQSIEALRQAGVRTVMITADQRESAAVAAAELGLDYASATAVDGRAIESLSDEELDPQLRGVNIFGCLSPTAKRRIVTGLREHGEVVAVVADARRDGPALTAADVPVVTAGRATEPLDTLWRAIRTGRTSADNVRKMIFFVASCAVAGALVSVVGVAAGWGLPQPVQVLWLGTVTVLLPAATLFFEPPQPDVMNRPPRKLRAELVSTKFLRTILGYGALIAGAATVVIVWTLASWVPTERAFTMAFLALGFAQLLHLGNARDSGAVVAPRRVFANALALLVVGLGVALQVMAVTTSLREVLHLEVIERGDWIIAAAAALLPALVGQTLKAVRR